MSHEYTLPQLLSRGITRQFVVPELQRDYVWKKRNWHLLATQLLDAYRQYVSETGTAVDEDYARWRQQQYLGYNLGFLYAYHDPHFAGYSFLIDGQQRLTTLLLMLLAAAVRGNRTDHFRRYFLTSDSEPFLAYRVREAAQEFLVRLVGHVLAGQPADSLQSTHPGRPHWFYQYYTHDATIQRLLKNYRGLESWLASALPAGAGVADALTAGGFYDYLCEAVRFWYFDTAESTQGEELYLSLNASSEPLTSSENLKAQLLADLPPPEKDEWGRQFEEWEQFFWEHRQLKPGHDASQGLDEFFRWVATCESLAPVPVAASAPAETRALITNSQGPTGVRDALLAGRARLSSEPAEAARWLLSRIGHYLAALRYLYDEWRPQAPALAATWPLPAAMLDLMLPATSWLSPEEALPAITCLRLLPVVAYLVGRGQHEWDVAGQGRSLLRVVRYFHNLSQVENVGKDSPGFALTAIRTAQLLAARSADIAALATLPPLSFTLDHELAKLALFAHEAPTPYTREQAESYCWQLEDEPHNQGEIRHLCGDLATLTHPRLEEIAAKYHLLFHGPTNRQQLQTLLLCYGPCYHLRSNHYYVSYEFDNWKFAVRRPEFGQLLVEMPVSDDAVSTLYQRRKRAFLAGLTAESLVEVRPLHEQLLVLAALFDEATPPSATQAGCGIWPSGNLTGWYYEWGPPAAPLFQDDRDLLNARGGFGYANSRTVHLLAVLRQQAGNRTVPELMQAALRAATAPAAQLPA